MPHSPTPWTKGGKYAENMTEIEDADGRTIAVVWTSTTWRTDKMIPAPCYKPCPKGQANLQMMIAAPELLAALEPFAELLDEDEPTDSDDVERFVSVPAIRAAQKLIKQLKEQSHA